MGAAIDRKEEKPIDMHGYEQYKAQSVNTMTRGELLLLLYDELVKRLTRAELAIGKQDYTLFEASITRCIEILEYLDDTLDPQYPISHDPLYRNPRISGRYA